MRKLFVYFFSLLLFLTGCEDKKKASSIETKVEIDVEDEVEGEDEVEEKKSNTYPLITNENMVSFLTQYGKENLETKVLLSTRFGNIEIELYEDTPLHRANFIYLVKQKYFDETFFHRIVRSEEHTSELQSRPHLV